MANVLLKVYKDPKAFYEVLEKGKFPILKKKLRWDPAASQQSGTEILSTGVEPATFEIFGNSSGLSIYFPYSENFGLMLTPEYFDNINTSMNGYLATIVPAVVEDDAAWGVQAVYTPNLPEGFEIPYTDVIVDDDFCETNGTQVLTPHDVISVDLTSKQIRNGNWKAVNSIWDANREADNLEQIFGIYEQDTQDEIIRQLSWNRESFYLYNQTGLGSCGTRNGWTIYDCGTNIRYTLPTQ